MSKLKKFVSKPRTKKSQLRRQVHASQSNVPAVRKPVTAEPVVTTRKRNKNVLLTVPRQVRNRVRCPKEGGVCAAVWSWLYKSGDHRLA